MKKKDREKSVSEIIEEVSVKICDDYCKYPDICKKEVTRQEWASWLV